MDENTYDIVWKQHIYIDIIWLLYGFFTIKFERKDIHLAELYMDTNDDDASVLEQHRYIENPLIDIF